MTIVCLVDCVQEMRVPKGDGEKLGISIRGGARNQAGNPLDKSDEGIFISRVSPPANPGS